MDRKRFPNRRLWLLFGLLAASTALLYFHRVLGPWEHSVDVHTGMFTSTMGDFYPRWVGTRALLIDGRNPYGPEVSHEIQIAYYGHPVVQKYDDPGTRILDEQRFAYPIYVVFLLAPAAHFSFATVQAWMPAVLMLLVAGSVLLWLAVLQWRPAWDVKAAIILFILATPQVVQGLHLRQLGFVVGFLLALAAWCVTRQRLVAAGAVLALATIKPQMAVLPLAWFLLWSMTDLRKRWCLIVGFAVSLVALIMAGELILPGWLGYFFAGLVAYRKYVSSPSLLQLALGPRVGAAAAVIVVLGVLVWAWKNRRQGDDSVQFAVKLSVFLVAASLAMPLFAPFNQILLTLPALMVLRDWNILPKIFRGAFVICISWPWIAEAVLLARPPDVTSLNRLPLLPLSLVLFVPLLITLLLASRQATPAAGARP